MPYFNYHATAKKLILDGKLIKFFYAEKWNSISPALVLVFNDERHPVMPIRVHKWKEYIELIDIYCS